MGVLSMPREKMGWSEEAKREGVVSRMKQTRTLAWSCDQLLSDIIGGLLGLLKCREGTLVIGHKACVRLVW
jgi:hypothetical protein